MNTSFEILKVLHESERSRVLLISLNEMGDTYILKENKSPTDARIYNEEALIKEMQAGLGTFTLQRDGKAAYCRPYFKGVTLAECIQSEPIDLITFLKIAIASAEKLAEIHLQHIIHKDISPGNLIYDKDSGLVQIIDFEYSTRMHVQEVSELRANYIQGTLPYIAPEQTGRTGKKLDYRCDLYSLGATLYELLCGVPPFSSNDPLELIYCHLAVLPPRVQEHRRDIPDVIGDIITKLLSKNAIERYQSLGALSSDLRFCQQSIEKTGSIPAFSLAQKDAWGTYNYHNEFLAGREQYSSQLLECINNRQAGARLLALKGLNGMGKTAFLKKIHGDSRFGKTLFGQFGMSGAEDPYLAWKDILLEYALRVSGYHFEYQAALGQSLQNELSGLESELLRLCPELIVVFHQVVDPLQTVVNSADSINRLLLAFNRLFEVLFRNGELQLLILDDLHLADESSQLLLYSVLTNHALKDLKICVSLRPNELNEGSLYVKWKQGSDRNEEVFRVEEFTLQALTVEDVLDYLPELLKGNADWRPAAMLIWQKTNGMPGLIRQLIRRLYEEKQFVWDHKAERWSYSVEEIRTLEIQTDLAQASIRQLKEMSDDVFHLLKYASVSGPRFSLSYIGLLSKRPIQEVHRSLWPVIQKGLIISLDSDYHFIPDYYAAKGLDNSFEFAYDSLWNIVFSELSQVELADFSEQLVAMIKIKESLSPIDISQLAMLLSRCSAAFLAKDTRWSFLQLQSAADQAMGENAFEKALKYYNACRKVLPPELSDNERGKLASKQLIATYHLLDFESFSDNYRSQLMEAEGPMEIARLKISMVNCYIFSSKFEEAMRLTEAVLTDFKEPIPSKASLLHLIWELIRTPVKKLDKLADLPDMQDETASLLQEFIKDASTAYFFLDKYKYAILSYRMIRKVFEFGLSSEGAVALSTGILTTGVLRNPEKARSVSVAIGKEIEKRNLYEAFPLFRFVEVFAVEHRFVPWRKLVSHSFEGYERGISLGNVSFAGWNHFMGVSYMLFSGYGLTEHLEQTERGYYMCKQFNQQSVADKYKWLLPTILTLRGKIAPTGPWDAYDFNEEACIAECLSEKGDRSNYVGWMHGKAFCKLLYGSVEEASDHLIQADKHINTLKDTVFQVWHAYLWVLTGMVSNVNVKKYLSFLQKNNASDVPDLSLVVEAYQVLNTIKDVRTAEKAYKIIDKQVDIADNGMLKAHLSNTFANKIKELEPDLASYYYQKAAITWDKWGAESLSTICRDKAAAFRSGKNNESLHTLQTSQSGEFDPDRLDVLTLIKSGEAILSEIRVEPLLKKLMHYVLENAGAQTSYFVMHRNGEWVVELVANAGEDKGFEWLNLPLHDNPFVAQSIIDHTEKTRKPLVLRDALEAEIYSTDVVVKANQYRSVLCLPLQHQSRITGFIFLVNNLMTNAFHEERVKIISLMSGQISMAIENALLYENMEQKVADRTRQLSEEKAKSDRLLRNILPNEIAEELKNNGKALARKLNEVSVMFTDFVNFTGLSRDLSPEDLVADIDEYFSAFDHIIEKHGIEKIKTIGDAYMCASGLPVPQEDHARRIVDAAIEILKFVEESAQERMQKGRPVYQIRIGINSGPVVAGIVGTKKFAYDIWGETVNIASRLENNSMLGRINISANTAKLLDQSYVLESRGKLPVKNLGELEMFFVEKAHSETYL